MSGTIYRCKHCGQSFEELNEIIDHIDAVHPGRGRRAT